MGGSGAPLFPASTGVDSHAGIRYTIEMLSTRYPQNR